MKILRVEAGSTNSAVWRNGLQRPVMLAALAWVLALPGCSQPTANAPAAPAATQAAVAPALPATEAAPALKSWEGTYQIYFATDSDGSKIPGGGAVIFDPTLENTVELAKSKEFSVGGQDSYVCTPNTHATAAWQHCLFFQIGTRAVNRPALPKHPLPIKPWNKSDPEGSKVEAKAIVDAIAGSADTNTERLVGSFLKDGKIEYLVLYRITDGIKEGAGTKDFLFVNLQDPAASGLQAFENGWATGGKNK